MKSSSFALLSALPLSHLLGSSLPEKGFRVTALDGVYVNRVSTLSSSSESLASLITRSEVLSYLQGGLPPRTMSDMKKVLIW
jgi:hypothetical protein